VRIAIRYKMTTMAATRKVEETPVSRAVDIVGGPTEASFITRASAATIYKWRKEGYVADSRAAVLLARATQEKGQPVSIAALAGLELVNGNGGEPEEKRAPRRLRKGGVMPARYHGVRPHLATQARGDMRQVVNG
jgi:hypothetical protein